jgi:hypothetical protein
MNIKAIAVAATIAVGTPVLALAQSTAPVQIDSTFIEPSFPASDGNTPGFAYVRFENETNVPATEVDFSLDANGRSLQTFKDVGDYRAGMAVEHRFDFALADAQHHQSISVASVTFADGTTWSKDEIPSASRRQSP